jgi:hypothetical protein
MKALHFLKWPLIFLLMGYLCILIGNFSKEQALGACRRIYYCRLFDNYHFGSVDDHKIYFFKTAGGRCGLTIPNS